MKQVKVERGNRCSSNLDMDHSFFTVKRIDQKVHQPQQWGSTTRTQTLAWSYQLPGNEEVLAMMNNKAFVIYYNFCCTRVAPSDHYY